MNSLQRRLVAVATAVLLVTSTTGSVRPGMMIAMHDHGWTHTLTTPLFDSATYVPGDSRTADLAVKNAASNTAALRIGIVGVSGDGALLSRLRLRAEPVTGDAETIDFARNRTAVLDPAVEPGQIVDTRLRLTLPRSAGNRTQRSNASFALEVILGDRHVVVPGMSGDGVPPAGSDEQGANDASTDARAHNPALPATGGATAIAAAAAAILIGLGAALVYAVRSRRKESR